MFIISKIKTLISCKLYDLIFSKITKKYKPQRHKGGPKFTKEFNPSQIVNLQ